MNIDDAKNIASGVWWQFTQRDVILLLIGAIIGGLIGWYFYVESGKELEAETKRLRELHNYTLIMLQNMQAGPGLKSTVERDAAGNPTGIGVAISTQPGIATATGEAALTVTKSK